MAINVDEQNKQIAELHAKQEEVVVKQLAGDVGLPYVDLSGIGINTDALRLISESDIGDWEGGKEKLRMAGFAMVGKHVDFAVQSPEGDGVQDQIKKLENQGFTVTLYLASMRSLRKAWGRYKDISQAEGSRSGLLDISDEALQKFSTEIKHNEDIKKYFDEIIEKKDVHQVTHLMELVFGSAIATKSSDVHFEGQEENARLRFRQDGVLQDIVYFDHPTYKRIVSRIKLLSEMKITSTATAQDGRFTIKYKGQEVEVRVSTVPGPYAEGIVMRILNPDAIARSFEELGIEPKLFAILDSEIQKPNGMIITTGPTGSGKTTTLYAFLRKLYTPEVKVMTIEDPIEYHLKGINQTQVEHEKGYDFLAGLRAALRQDPDIIMVGEIRDKETATIAVNASLTGHMVLSTLHTNNAAGAIPRLLDLGIQPGILSSALTVSIGQRLVRRLCKECKKVSQVSAEDTALLHDIIGHAERVGKDLSAYSLKSTDTYTIYEAAGCAACNMTGYSGRVGLYEAILTDDNIADIMTKSPTSRDIKRVADKQGILSMVEDGAIKIILGMTSIDEVESVVDLFEDAPLRKESAEARGVPVADLGKEKEIVSESKQELDSTSINQAWTPGPDKKTISWHTHELALLIDYLKLLEQQQVMHPESGIAHKIEDIQKTILGILKHENIDEYFSGANAKELVRQEITNIQDELKLLQESQEKNPSAGIAEELATFRNRIQALRGSTA